MQGSKVMFSESELKLVADKEVILTKMQIIEKVYEAFGKLGNLNFDAYQLLSLRFPELYQSIPKISKGEFYEGFPWVMLDFPKVFNKKEGHFAVRNFFWWGHGFYFQLHFSGQYLTFHEPLLLHPDFRELIDAYNVYAGQPEDPWVHKLPQIGLQKISDLGRLAKSDTYFKMIIPVSFENLTNLVHINQRMANIISKVILG